MRGLLLEEVSKMRLEYPEEDVSTLLHIAGTASFITQ